MVSSILHPCCVSIAYLLPVGHVAAYSVPLAGGAFLWSGRVYR